MSTTETISRKDVYTRITDKIVSALEQGTRPWIRPWNAEHAAGRITRPLRHNGIPYSGINVIMLWQAATACGYNAPYWMTYRQANELGGQVRKGERGELVVYANKIKRTEAAEDGSEIQRDVAFLKGFTVFCVDQIDGLPSHYHQLASPTLDPVQRIERADAFFAATGAQIEHGGSMACYSVTLDRIKMPPFETFRDAESYYATLAHECAHWTRHPSRLDRDFGRKNFGDEGYALEELVAEISSAYLCVDLELALEPREDHAAYIENWLQVLKNDKRAIFAAAAHAQRAADYLNALQPQAAATESAA